MPQIIHDDDDFAFLTIRQMEEADEAEGNARPTYLGYGIPASDLANECARSLWYSLRWVSEPERLTWKSVRVFERGDWEETRMLARLRRAGFDVADVDPATGKQFAFTLADGWIRGKADGTIRGIPEAPKALHVLEIKSMKAETWRAIVKKGVRAVKPEHWHQLHAGMAGLDIERGLYVCANKDTEEIHAERIRLDREEMAKHEARVLMVVRESTPPPKVSEDHKRPPCLFCKHKEVCHFGAWPKRTCRSCASFTLTSDGNGRCERFGKDLGPEEQQACPEHLFIPPLVPGGKPIDSDADAHTVTYRMADGSIWTDGAEREGAA